MNQIYSPPLSRLNKILILAIAIPFIIGKFLSLQDVHLLPYLGLSVAGIKQGLLYQIVTYPFFTTSFMSVLFECLLLWFLGSEIERIWGEKLYLQYLAVCVLGAGLIYIGISWTLLSPISQARPLFGMAGFSYALCLAYAIMFSDRYLNFMLIFPMKAKWFCLIMVIMLLYFGMAEGDSASWAHLAAMAIGFVFLKSKAAKLSGKPVLGGFSNFFKKFKKKRKHPVELYIIKNDDDEDKPTYH